MPPAIILSPYSGRAVKIREQDLGRALRDEEGRVFYVVEDPEHGRYAARTRKGSPKDLERYRKIEADAAQLDDATQPARQNLAQAHDAAGNKRRNPLGLLVIVLLLAASAALGYVYLNHPDWLGLGTAPTREAATPKPTSRPGPRQHDTHSSSTRPRARAPGWTGATARCRATRGRRRLSLAGCSARKHRGLRAPGGRRSRASGPRCV